MSESGIVVVFLKIIDLTANNGKCQLFNEQGSSQNSRGSCQKAEKLNPQLTLPTLIL